MITIKKSELEGILLSIVTFDAKTNKIVGGLLSESVSLGTKRKLQKIHKALVEEYKQLINDVKEIEEAFKDAPDIDKKNLEIKELLDEVIKVEAEPFALSQLDNIVTSNNYDFELLEKIGV